MQFIWDTNKDRTNRRDHGLDFETAARVFDDPFAYSEQDRVAFGEPRWQILGSIGAVMVVLVAFTYWEETGGEELVRIISARRATRHERRKYENEKRYHG